MTLTTAAIIYYSFATPALLLVCRMMCVGGKDTERPTPNTYGDLPPTFKYPPLEDKAACVVAASRLSAELAHTMNDVGIDGTQEDLNRMLTNRKA